MWTHHSTLTKDFKSFYRLTTPIPRLNDQRKTSGAMKYSLLSSEGALQAGLADAVLAHQHEACAKHRLRPIGAGLVICSHCIQTACQNLPRGVIWKHHPHSSSVIFKTFLVLVCTHLIDTVCLSFLLCKQRLLIIQFINIMHTK